MTIKNKKSVFNFIKKHPTFFGWLFAFFLMFSAGMRNDWMAALIVSTYTVLVMVIYQLFLHKVLVKYLVNKKPTLYYLFSFITLTLFAWLFTHLEISLIIHLHKIELIKPFPGMFDEKFFIIPHFRMIIFLLGTFAVTTTMLLLKRDRESYLEREQLMRAKLEMELRYLKSQINPHFLFNALNNIYSMVYSHDENAPESILILSEMLRYVTVDCQADRLSLEKEIKYIDRYIELQLMKMENKPNVIFEKEIQNPDFKIVPMLLQPLVENCFKHSRLDTFGDGHIYMKATQNREDGFIFVAENSVVPSIITTRNNESEGIGVINVQKRLELLYGDKFSMHVENNSQFYRVELKISE